ncbi:unnamed protein product [Mytilus coruscus]|uniref:Uncharacterized protein n=1 Tax=Mytilus coruscus TaxID=42192 RepID=A0A6J7ZUF3_MYTCO|nr:unnamed protein product [Mytilus coruscus]
MIGSIPLAGQNPSHFATVPEEEVIEMNMEDHDYEEIDETNMFNDSMNIDNTIHESETDSRSGSTISPTEDDEGYLHPYHSLVHLKMMANFVLEEHHSATDLRSNKMLQNPYDHLQIPIKIPTTSGFECMEIMDGSPTNFNKSDQEHAIENTVDPSCSLEDKNKRFYAEPEEENLPAQEDQSDGLF